MVVSGETGPMYAKQAGARYSIRTGQRVPQIPHRCTIKAPCSPSASSPALMLTVAAS